MQVCRSGPEAWGWLFYGAPVQTLTCPLTHIGAPSYSFSKHFPRLARDSPLLGPVLPHSVSQPRLLIPESRAQRQKDGASTDTSQSPQSGICVIWRWAPFRKEQAENTVINLKFTSNILIGVFILRTKVILSFNVWLGRCSFPKEKYRSAQRIHVVKIKTSTEYNKAMCMVFYSVRSLKKH